MTAAFFGVSMWLPVHSSGRTQATHGSKGLVPRLGGVWWGYGVIDATDGLGNHTLSNTFMIP